MNDCVFCRIGRKEVPADIVWEDDDIVAFRDLHPQAPVHVLVIPRRHLSSVVDLGPDDGELAAKLLNAAVQVAGRAGLAGQKAGFRLVTNTGPDAGQSVEHLHWHVLGGRRLQWPPG